MVVLELIRELRETLYDISDTGEPPAGSGCKYYWEYDDSDLIWKNAELLRYLNAAGDELALRVPIHDSGRSSVTRVAVRPGTDRYHISPRILAIDDVLLESDRSPLENLSGADEYNSRYDGERRYASPRGIRCYRSDFDERVLTVYDAPLAADTLLLSVRRYPIEPLRWESRACQEPEFPEHCQRSMVDWAASLAYRKRDSDKFNIDLAQYHQGQFAASTGPQIDFRAARVRGEIAGRRVRTRTQYY